MSVREIGRARGIEREKKDGWVEGLTGRGTERRTREGVITGRRKGNQGGRRKGRRERGSEKREVMDGGMNQTKRGKN